MQYDVAVVGGGASGLVAAICAARAGAKTVIVEKNLKPGKKILASGNGRCNLGNEDLSLRHFVSHSISLLEYILAQFNGQDALRFFHDLGLEVVYEEGRIYPRSMQAAAVLEVLLHEIEHLRVQLETNTVVKSIAASKHGFVIENGAGQALSTKRVVMATGGKAGPKLGSSGDGYDFAQKLGHSVIQPMPALLGLKLKSPYNKELAGLRTRATVSISALSLSETGEVIFTDYGISGIPVFDLTRAIRDTKNLTLTISLTPDIESLADLAEVIKKRFRTLAYKSAQEALIGFIPKQLTGPVLQLAHINHKNAAASLTEHDANALAKVLWSSSYPILGTNTWEQAQTTSGGIPLDEVCTESLQSKLVPGLFFAGELLDVHGRCGGYNLHWAWASGYIAGRNAGMG